MTERIDSLARRKHNKMTNRPTWTTAADLVEVLRKRWMGGRYLRDHASGVEWEPIVLPVRGPKASELLEKIEEASRWLASFERECHSASGASRFSIEYRTIKSRTVGSNMVPSAVRIETLEQLCALLGTSDDLEVLDSLIAETRMRVPELVSWVAAYPMRAIANRVIWSRLLATIEWIAAHETNDFYLRHIDVEGVDTKFVGVNRNLLSELLDQVLPIDRIEADRPRSDFAKRYRFREKPTYVRFRSLSPERSTGLPFMWSVGSAEFTESTEAALRAESATFPPGVSELTLRARELESIEPIADRVFIIENEISYLAFPDVPDAIAIFGAGFAAETLKTLSWLDRKKIVYWGDIDTYGFVILDRLRERFPDVRSMLMDRPTLLAHQSQWVTEDTPINRSLVHLTEEESDLYRALVEGHHGSRVRLEQERVRFSRVQRAVADEYLRQD